jgi:hypothetical protein
MSSRGEESVTSDKEKNVNDNSSKQHGRLAKPGAERPRFPFTSKSGIYVNSEDPSNTLEYFELFRTPEIAEVIARERNQYAPK